MIRNEKGFTLIELMVVVLIIGILVAVAIPVFGSAAANARDKACTANIRTIAGAVAQYNAEYNTVTATIAQLVGASFLKSAPTDPHPAGGGYAIDGAGVVSVVGGHPNDNQGNAFPTF